MSVTWPGRPNRPPLSSSTLLVGALGLAVGGLGLVSYSLVPDRMETSLMALDRGDPSTAEATLDLAVSGRPVPAGDVQGLVNMALELSRPDRATALLRDYVAAHPTNVPALRQLADVLEQQHRTADAADVLEQLYSLTNDVEVLRLVAGIYASLGMGPRRVDALQRLFARKAEDSDQLLELAERLAAAGNRTEALGDLLARLETNPADPTATGLAGLGAALSIEQPDAPGLAARLGHTALTAERLRSVAQTYIQRGALALALAATRAARPELQQQPAVILTLAELEVQNGEEPAALARLQSLVKAGTLSQDALPLLIDLELRRGDVLAAIHQVASLPAEAMPIGFGSRLVEVARETGNLDALRPLDPAQFRIEPTAASAIAFIRGDRAGAAGYASAALTDAAALPDDLQAFRDVLGKLGMDDAALTRLLAATKERRVTVAGLRLLLILVGNSPARGAAALPVLASVRDTLPGAGPVWAVLAASAGPEPAVLAWLKTTLASGGRIETGMLLDLLGLAVQRHQPGLAGVAAAALQTRTDLPAGWTAQEVALLGAAAQAVSPGLATQALALMAQPGTGVDARTRLSELLAGAPNPTEILHAAHREPAATAILVADVSAGAGGLDGIAARLQVLVALDPAAAVAPLQQREPADPVRLGPLLVSSQLTAGNDAAAMATLRGLLAKLPGPQQEALLFNIRATAGTGRDLAVIELGANLLGGSWEQAYQEALEHRGMHGQLVSRLRGIAARGTQAERIAIASRLVELGDKPAAIALLKPLTESAGPQSPLVQQVLYLYGPTGDPDAVAWVRSRALVAPAADFPGWVNQLEYLGSPSAVASVIEARPDMLARNAKLADTYADALVRTGGRNRLAAITQAAKTARDPAVLKSLSRAAEDANQPSLARLLSAQAVAAAPDDAEALVQAARHALAARRSADAVTLFARAVQRAPLSADDAIDYGDALVAQNRRSEAAAEYRHALTKLPTEPGEPTQARQRARALHGLGMDGEASALLDRLLRTHPSDAGLRADLLQIAVDAH